MYTPTILFQEWLWCETWCSDGSKSKVNAAAAFFIAVLSYCLCTMQAPHEDLNHNHHLSPEASSQ
jgi:hypothetical protein